MTNRSFILLSLLAANDRLGEDPVRRTTLVKQAFLADTIRPLYRVWLRSFSFVRYYYGPYSDEIFQRLDTLIFNGLVTVTRLERSGGRIEARYQISEAGRRLLEHFADSVIVSLASDLIWALQALGVTQASTICKLVYQEAEFARLFAQHTDEGIGPETRVPLPPVTSSDNETFVTLATLEQLQLFPSGHASLPALPTREMVRLFLLSLAHRIPRRHGYARSADEHEFA